MRLAKSTFFNFLKGGFRKANRVGIIYKGDKIMKEEILRDKSNRMIGRIRENGSGKIDIFDHQNKIKGTYDPRRNETRDKSNKLVGKGNLLTSLLD